MSRTKTGRTESGQADSGHAESGRFGTGRTRTGRGDNTGRGDTGRTWTGRRDGRRDAGRRDSGRHDSGRRDRPNYAAGLGVLLWLCLVALPLYVMLGASVQSRAQYTAGGPLAFPESFSLTNYVQDFSNGFGRYFLNTVVVTASVVGIVLLLVPPLAFAIVRDRGRGTSRVFRLFLLGLAIPAQAVIVPMFYVISNAGLYDNLIGIILPTAAFALPVCVLILTGTMRDITDELFEAMALDGASTRRVFFQLVVPLSKSGLATIVVFSALQAWNGFLFPLVLTQSEETKVLTLGLYNFQTQYGIDIPGLLAAVVLSTLPVLLVYLFARRALVQGLMGVGGK